MNLKKITVALLCLCMTVGGAAFLTSCSKNQTEQSSAESSADSSESSENNENESSESKNTNSEDSTNAKETSKTESKSVSQDSKPESSESLETSSESKESSKESSLNNTESSSSQKVSETEIQEQSSEKSSKSVPQDAETEVSSPKKEPSNVSLSENLPEYKDSKTYNLFFKKQQSKNYHVKMSYTSNDVNIQSEIQRAGDELYQSVTLDDGNYVTIIKDGLLYSNSYLMKDKYYVSEEAEQILKQIDESSESNMPYTITEAGTAEFDGQKMYYECAVSRSYIIKSYFYEDKLYKMEYHAAGNESYILKTIESYQELSVDNSLFELNPDYELVYQYSPT